MWRESFQKGGDVRVGSRERTVEAVTHDLQMHPGVSLSPKMARCGLLDVWKML